MFFFSRRRRHTRWTGDWSSDVCSSDLESRLSNYPAPGSGGPPGQVTEYAFSSAKDQRLLVAKRTGAPGEAWASVRSEERRVGKECRYGRSPYYLIKCNSILVSLSLLCI